MTTSKPGFGVRFGAVVLLAVVLAACSSPTRNRAPVEERAPTTRTPAGAVAAPVAAPAGAAAHPPDPPWRAPRRRRDCRPVPKTPASPAITPSSPATP
jgi:hypothetical protein